jgi:FAD synthase
MELPKRFSGEIIRGFGRGHRTLGFATANLTPQSWAINIADDGYGVYAGLVRIRGEPARIGVVSVGRNFTFDAKSPTFEVHILDFDEDIYGVTMDVDLRTRIRSMMPFKDLDSLKAQITADTATAREAITPLLTG